MNSFLQILLISFSSLSTGIMVFWSVMLLELRPSFDNDALGFIMFMTVCLVMLLAIPTILATSVAWSLYEGGSSWRRRLLFFFCIVIVGSTVTRLVLFKDPGVHVLFAIVMSACAMGLVGTYLIPSWKQIPSNNPIKSPASAPPPVPPPRKANDDIW